MDTRKTFTDEARRHLEASKERLANELEEEAVSEALRSRGEPVEVTGTDVRKAVELFMKRDRPSHSSADIIFKIYVVLGAAMFVGGLLYPFVRKIVLEYGSEARISLLVAAAGLLLAGCAFWLRSSMRTSCKGRRFQRAEKKEIRPRDKRPASAKEGIKPGDKRPVSAKEAIKPGDKRPASAKEAIKPGDKRPASAEPDSGKIGSDLIQPIP